MEYPDWLIARFWSKVDKKYKCECHSWRNRCWIWTEGCTVGYGCFHIPKSITGNKQRNIKAHRFAFAIRTNGIPENMQVNHFRGCRMKVCVRHLKLGTYQSNSDDKIFDGTQIFGMRCGSYTHPERQPRGERHGKAVFTENEVHKIFILHNQGYLQREIVTVIGGSQSTISAILRGYTWKHIWEQHQHG